MGFTIKRVLRRVLRRGSEKGVSRRCLEHPLVEYAPLGVRPSFASYNPELFSSRSARAREAGRTLLDWACWSGCEAPCICSSQVVLQGRPGGGHTSIGIPVSP